MTHPPRGEALTRESFTVDRGEGDHEVDYYEAVRVDDVLAALRARIAALEQDVSDGDAALRDERDCHRQTVAQLKRSASQQLAAKDARVEELEEMRIKYGPICLNCGKDKPCMTEEEANIHGASIPCTFDPAPKEIWQRWKDAEQQLTSLKAAFDGFLFETAKALSPDDPCIATTTEQILDMRRRLDAMRKERDIAIKKFDDLTALLIKNKAQVQTIRRNIALEQQLTTAREQATRLRGVCQAMTQEKVNGYIIDELLDKVQPLFEKNGAYQNMYALNVLREARQQARQALAETEEG